MRFSELGPDLVDCLLAHLEGLREHIVGDRRRRSKDSITDSDNARVLAAEAGNGHRVGVPVVVLVVG